MIDGVIAVGTPERGKDHTGILTGVWAGFMVKPTLLLS